MKSNSLSLRANRRPLAIDAVYEENFVLVDEILELSDAPHTILSMVYEYSNGHAKEKESILSYACHRCLEGNSSILQHFLALDTQNVFLTTVTLSGMGIRALPVALMHPNLLSLDVRENNLYGYPSVDPDNLGWNCPKLHTLNFSNNHFTYIHPDIFNLPSLVRLFMNGNEITEVPVQMWMSPHLGTLELSNNLIQDLPCPQFVYRNSSVNMFLFGCRTKSLPRRRKVNVVDGEASLPSLRKSCINYSSRSIHKQNINFVLNVLDLSGNQLSSIPRGLACLAPLLETLKLSRNRITSLGSVCDYPALLRTLDVSDNGLTRGFDPPPVNIANKVSCVQSQLATKEHPSCFHMQHVDFSCLKYLYLCNNHIEDLVLEYENEDHLADTLGQFDLLKPMEESGSVLFFPNLHGLKVRNNSLTRVPLNIHKLTKLRELIVSHNEGITELPPLLHKLIHLYVFRHDGVANPIVKELAHLRNTLEVLHYLKAREIE